MQKIHFLVNYLNLENGQPCIIFMSEWQISVAVTAFC